jgi:hypothetical protein
VADPNANQTLLSKFLSPDWAQQQCAWAYAGMISSPPAVDHINKYGGWNMTPARTFFTNGECA